MEQPRRKQVWIEDRADNRLPFSKAVLAATIMVVGVSPEVAHRIAEDIEDSLLAEPDTTTHVDDLVRRTETAVLLEAGRIAAARYAAWIEARRQQRPILVLLGGGAGVGKSTVAAGVGAKLGITPVVPTDAIREVMRSSLSADIAPALHVSSFEAHTALRAPVPDDHDAVVAGFRQQAEMVATGIRGLIRRALREGTNLIVEGAHILPGMYDDELRDWEKRGAYCQAVIDVPDPDDHRAHFLTRLERAPGREPQRYLDGFAEIRRIQRFICRAAEKRDVPLVHVGGLDDAVQEVVNMVVESVTGTPDQDARPH